MGSGRPPTPKQKERIRAAGLNPHRYLVLAQIGSRLVLEYRGTGRMQVIVTESKQKGVQGDGSFTKDVGAGIRPGRTKQK